MADAVALQNYHLGDEEDRKIHNAILMFTGPINGRKRAADASAASPVVDTAM